jgi:hypothetical protein
VKKRTLEGTSLTNQNSFALFDNDLIVSLAADMGLNIVNEHFDTVEFMKDFEVARHALEKVKKKEIVNPNEIEERLATQTGEIPMLEWIDEESEGEQFTLVQSRKKKKKQVHIQLESLVKGEPVRRSKRTAPSVYRNKRSQENLEPKKRNIR